MQYFNQDFLIWIQKVLYYPEQQVLKKYISTADTGEFTLINTKAATDELGISRDKLYKILWKLEFLARLFEERVNPKKHLRVPRLSNCKLKECGCHDLPTI